MGLDPRRLPTLKLRPDRQPVVWPQVAASNFAVGRPLDSNAPLNGDASVLPVAQGLRGYAYERR